MGSCAQDIAKLYELLCNTNEELCNFTRAGPGDLSVSEAVKWVMEEEDRLYGVAKELGLTTATFNDLFNHAFAKATRSPYLAESVPKMEMMAKICGITLRELIGEDRDSARMRAGMILSLQN